MRLNNKGRVFLKTVNLLAFTVLLMWFTITFGKVQARSNDGEIVFEEISIKKAVYGNTQHDKLICQN